jgi:hypothetical protein
MDGDKPVNRALLAINILEPRQGTPTAMDAKYLVIYNDTKGEKVEHVREMVPNIGVSIFPGAFGIEAVGLGDAAGFMVPPDQVDAIWVSKL